MIFYLQEVLFAAFRSFEVGPENSVRHNEIYEAKFVNPHNRQNLKPHCFWLRIS